MTMLTKKAISRRTMLRGVGATVALPLLDAMVPAMTALAATPAKPVRRFGAVYVPNGMVMRDWTPAAEGAAFELTPILRPLASFRERMLVLSGLNSAPPGGRGGVHAGASTKFLTAVHPDLWNRGEPIVSVDQLIARELGRETPLASLELGLEGSEFAGSCDVGYSCAYSYTISWRDQATPLPMEHNPRAVFERLFGDVESTDPRDRRRRKDTMSSILDSVLGDMARIRRNLGPTDRLKVDSYFEAVRGVERRIEVIEARAEEPLVMMDQPPGIPATFPEHSELMYELMRLAYQIDHTRVATFMLGHELSGRTYPEIGVPDAHHPLSHHKGNEASLEKLSKVNMYHVEQFASFLTKLEETPDGDGSLLDHVLLVYGAGMSDSNLHSPRDLPILLVGGGSGQVKGGEHLVYPRGTPLANLHLTLMDKLGVEVESLGDSTGELPIPAISDPDNNGAAPLPGI